MKTILILISCLIATDLCGQTVVKPYRLGIFVHDVDKAARWYADNLDFTTYKKMEFPQYDSLRIFFLRNPGFEIELIEKKTSQAIKQLKPDFDANKTPLEGFSKIAFRVDHLRQLYGKLTSRGVTELMGISHDDTFNEDFFIVMDADGNVLQFIESTSK